MRLSKSLKKIGVLSFPLILFWIIFLYILITSLNNNQGTLIYPLDDTYIHLAIAENLAKYGTWGINKNDFSSSSSSIIYTLLLALSNTIFGVNILAPLIINLVFAHLLILFCYKIILEENISNFIGLISLSFLVLFLPLPVLTFIGMEHVLHTLVSLSYIYLTSKLLSKGLKKTDIPFFKNTRILITLSISSLIPLIRFEGIFLISIVSVLCFLKKEFQIALLNFLIGFLPLTIYGLISLQFGGFFFPNSIMIKATFPKTRSIMSLIYFIYYRILALFNAKHLLLLIVISSLIFFLSNVIIKDFWNQINIFAVILIFITICQIFFASVGNMGIYWIRYDAFLIALGIVMITLFVNKIVPEDSLIKRFRIKKLKSYLNSKSFIEAFSYLLVFFVIFTPLMQRAYFNTTMAPQASKNIHDQQYHMAKFLRRYYNNQTVALNDIGIANFLTDIECIDLWGLANNDVAKAKLNRTYNTAFIFNLAKKQNCSIAIVYDHWFYQYGGIPTAWIKVGHWRITENVVCGGSIVTFYAVDPNEKDDLISNLNAFSENLPADVIESGTYLNY